MELKELDILLIEEFDPSRKTLEELLLFHVNSVVSASNGFDGLTKYNESIFHLIIVDYKMKGMDGVEVAHKIREMEKANQTYTPIILWTGYPELDYLKTEYIPPCNLIVPKPLDIESYLSEIDNLINRS